jgi:uncharacterized protein Yka (UPF0111/DUF47 family)
MLDESHYYMIGIFRMNSEDKVFSKLVEIAKNSKDMVNSLSDIYAAVKRRDREAEIAGLIKVKTIYEKVAFVREETMSLLFSEAFLPDFKESMTMLVQSLYQLSKSIKDAARAYTSRRVSEKCLSALGEQMDAYLSIVDEASNKLIQLMSILRHDLGEAVKIGREIQLLERSGDEVKDSMLFRLYSMEGEVDVVSLLQFKDIILFTDDILDYMEEATMSVELLYATLKS